MLLGNAIGGWHLSGIAAYQRQEGFVGLVAPGRTHLKTIQGKTLWDDAESPIVPGQEYVLEGSVTTDRVAFRVLAAEGTTVLVASPTFTFPSPTIRARPPRPDHPWNSRRIPRLGIAKVNVPAKKGVGFFFGFCVTMEVPVGRALFVLVNAVP